MDYWGGGGGGAKGMLPPSHINGGGGGGAGPLPPLSSYAYDIKKNFGVFLKPTLTPTTTSMCLYFRTGELK